jgi:hypothetical protein
MNTSMGDLSFMSWLCRFKLKRLDEVIIVAHGRTELSNALKDFLFIKRWLEGVWNLFPWNTRPLLVIIGWRHQCRSPRAIHFEDKRLFRMFVRSTPWRFQNCYSEAAAFMRGEENLCITWKKWTTKWQSRTRGLREGKASGGSGHKCK